MPWVVREATRPLSQEPVSLRVEGGESVIDIANVNKHDVLVVE